MHAPLLTRVGQIALTVPDLDAAIAYYRDALGLPMLFRAGAMAFFDCGGTRLLLGTENTTAQGTLLYFFVDDIHRAHGVLAARGVRFEEDPHLLARLPDREVWLARFTDPAGTIHHLMSEVWKPQG